MYSRSSRYPLGTLSKVSFRFPNLSVPSRGFGSTGQILSLAISHKTSSGPVNATTFISKPPESSPLLPVKKGPVNFSHSIRTKPMHPRSPKDTGPAREVHIAVKVRNLCQAGKLDQAVEVCVGAPAALQGATAWNTIIHHALSEERYNYAYTLYQQMKRRHIVPTISTYTSFMSAYAHAKPKNLTAIQLERIHKLYKDWSNLAASARTENAINAITWVPPAAAYISVLGNAKLYQSIWDVFYDLETEGPLAPNQFVFTNMFVAFHKRTTTSTNTLDGATSKDAVSANDISANFDPNGIDTVAPTPSSDIKIQNAQDARLLWRLLLRALERCPFPVDSHLVVAALRALQHGEKPELDLALEIIDKYLNLRAPSAPAPSKTSKALKLNFRLLDVALSVCNAAKRPDLTRHFLDVLTAPEHPQRYLVNAGAMNHLIKAYISLGDTRQVIRTIDWMIREGALPGGLDVMPGGSSWSMALRGCLDAQDWSAAKTLTKRLASTVNSKRIIDPETIYLVLKITYVLKPPNKQLHERQLRQALDAVYYVVNLWPKNPNAMQPKYAEDNPVKAERRLVFRNALGDLVKKILNEFEGLKTIPGFNDLGYRLKELRTRVPADVSAQYEAYL
ncbi:PPR repeat family [Rhizoctonia solani]|uniref:PPR repeat family n=1 Tax=Rhizoctonia solani TaxID=456999 RepID=A0A8H7HCF3_9AGAM|nr:PPR repeat family [Rhizoctonia solani]